MNSSRIPGCVQIVDAFIKSLKIQVGDKQTPQAQDLFNAWSEIKSFADTVFYPAELIEYAAKASEMELDQEAQEEVDFLFFELIQAGMLPNDTQVKDK